MNKEKCKLKCEKVLNEAWGILQKHDQLLKNALSRKRGERHLKEKLILSMSSRVAYMQIILDEANDEEYGLNFEYLEDVEIE